MLHAFRFSLARKHKRELIVAMSFLVSAISHADVSLTSPILAAYNGTIQTISPYTESTPDIRAWVYQDSRQAIVESYQTQINTILNNPNNTVVQIDQYYQDIQQLYQAGVRSARVVEGEGVGLNYVLHLFDPVIPGDVIPNLIPGNAGPNGLAIDPETLSHLTGQIYRRLTMNFVCSKMATYTNEGMSPQAALARAIVNGEVYAANIGAPPGVRAANIYATIKEFVSYADANKGLDGWTYNKDYRTADNAGWLVKYDNLLYQSDVLPSTDLELLARAQLATSQSPPNLTRFRSALQALNIPETAAAVLENQRVDELLMQQFSAYLRTIGKIWDVLAGSKTGTWVAKAYRAIYEAGGPYWEFLGDAVNAYAYAPVLETVFFNAVLGNQGWTSPDSIFRNISSSVGTGICAANADFPLCRDLVQPQRLTFADSSTGWGYWDPDNPNLYHTTQSNTGYSVFNKDDNTMQGAVANKRNRISVYTDYFATPMICPDSPVTWYTVAFYNADGSLQSEWYAQAVSPAPGAIVSSLALVNEIDTKQLEGSAPSCPTAPPPGPPPPPIGGTSICANPIAPLVANSDHSACVCPRQNSYLQEGDICRADDGSHQYWRLGACKYATASATNYFGDPGSGGGGGRDGEGDPECDEFSDPCPPPKNDYMDAAARRFTGLQPTCNVRLSDSLVANAVNGEGIPTSIMFTRGGTANGDLYWGGKGVAPFLRTGLWASGDSITLSYLGYKPGTYWAGAAIERSGTPCGTFNFKVVAPTPAPGAVFNVGDTTNFIGAALVAPGADPAILSKIHLIVEMDSTVVCAGQGYACDTSLTGSHPGPHIFGPNAQNPVNEVGTHVIRASATIADIQGIPIIVAVSPPFSISVKSPTVNPPAAPQVAALQGMTIASGQSLTLPGGADPSTTFNWKIAAPSASATSAAARASAVAATSQSGSPDDVIAAVSTSNPTLDFSKLHLSPGTYTIYVQSVTGGVGSAWSSFTVTLAGSADLSAVRVFPNPWRADGAKKTLTFAGMPAGSTVKIFTVSGHAVATLSAPMGSADWDLANSNGEKVQSGLYLYLITDGNGGKTHGKFAVIR